MSQKFGGKYRIQSARAQWWDYANNGMYFVTICTQHRKHFFGDIVETPNYDRGAMHCASTIVTITKKQIRTPIQKFGIHYSWV